jgi:hypothetical protein
LQEPDPLRAFFSHDLQVWERGYLVQAVATTEAVVGVLLLSGRFLPLALVVFAPILFHIFLQFAGVEAALAAAVFYGHLVWIQRDRFSDILTPQE